MTDRRRQAKAIVKRNASWAFACGLVPLPIVDAAAFTLVHLRMLEQLAAHYEVPYSRVRAESYLAAFLGSFTATKIGLGALHVGLSMIPVAGPVLGLASMSVASASMTYAIGRIFIREFESGTMFNADPVSSPVNTVAEVPRPSVEPAPAPQAPSPQAPSSPAPSTSAPSKKPDDLAIIKGIGPKIADLLEEKGILTFAALAATSVASLQGILDDAGKGFSHHDPATWPAQARLAADGKMDELAALWNELQKAD